MPAGAFSRHGFPEKLGPCSQEIRSVVIAGGGTAGWMTAAALARVLGPRLSITLVESAEIGIVGVGEATIPAIGQFNKLLKIDENDFLRQTQGTFKLGIEFVDWYEKGHAYMHAFGPVGRDLAYIPFHHYWLRDQAQGSAGSLWDYSLNWLAAKQARFSRVERIADTPLAGLTWAFHFDASLYAAYLSRLAQASGVRKVEGMIAEVLLEPERGDVRALQARRTDASSPRTSSSTARAFAACSSSRRCRPDSRTGRSGCPAIARWPCRPRTPARCCRIRARRRSRPAGSGASRCSTAPATATSIVRRT